MNSGILGTKVIVQLGIIVKDINITVEKYLQFFDVDNPQVFITDIYEKAQTQYRGKPTSARAKIAFLHVEGGLEIELIEPDENPSIWREFLDTYGEGTHHIAFFVKDINGKIKLLEELGMPLVQKGKYSGGEYSYIDTTEHLKIMIELLENY